MLYRIDHEFPLLVTTVVGTDVRAARCLATYSFEQKTFVMPTEMKTKPNPIPESIGVNDGANHTALVQAFTAAFTSDNVESLYRHIDPDGEWVIVAVGETSHGLDQIKLDVMSCSRTT